MSITNFFSASLRAQRQFFLVCGMILALVLLAIPTTAGGQVSETPNRWIRGVAKVTLDRSGKSQISFNPQRCRELGPELCEFFRTHEYGHVNLRHLERGVAAPKAEAEADLWAAKNASPSAVRAAKQFFLSGKGGSRIHGTPQERARRMDAGASSTVKRSTTSVRSQSRTAPPRGNRRVTKAAPKSYSATSKRKVRYRVKPAAASTSRSLSVAKTTQSPSKTVRYVVRKPPIVAQSSRRTSSGYVPRGDFLNPR